jgi:hypothetical protein
VICPLVPGSEEIAYVSALVAGGMLWLFGTNDLATATGQPRTQVHAFWSADPALRAESWKHSVALQLDQSGSNASCPFPPSPAGQGNDTCSWWTAFNTSPTLSGPTPVAGALKRP